MLHQSISSNVILLKYGKADVISGNTYSYKLFFELTDKILKFLHRQCNKERFLNTLPKRNFTVYILPIVVG